MVSAGGRLSIENAWSERQSAWWFGELLNATDWVSKGVILYKSGDYQKAIHAFSIAIDLDLTFSAAYLTRAVAYYKLGDKKQATQNLEVAARLGHKNARVFLKKFTK